MAKGLNIDEILASLEQEKTAEESFAEGVSSEEKVETADSQAEAATEEVVADAPEATEESTDSEEKVAESNESTEEVSDDAETEKVAAEMDAQGRIMAQAFMDELQKIAVGDAAYMPHNDDAKKDQKELMKGDIPEGGKVDAVVAKLKELEGAARSGSYVQHGDMPVPAAPKAADESFGTTSADMGKAAEANDDVAETPEGRIVGALYDSYFAEEEGSENE